MILENCQKNVDEYKYSKRVLFLKIIYLKMIFRFYHNNVDRWYRFIKKKISYQRMILENCSNNVDG